MIPARNRLPDPHPAVLDHLRRVLAPKGDCERWVRGVADTVVVDRIQTDALAVEVGSRIEAVVDLLTQDAVSGVATFDMAALRDQLLIILADYRDHAYTLGRWAFEGTRMSLADALIGVRFKPNVGGTHAAPPMQTWSR